jgi:hypothetical protein
MKKFFFILTLLINIFGRSLVLSQQQPTLVFGLPKILEFAHFFIFLEQKVGRAVNAINIPGGMAIKFITTI